MVKNTSIGKEELSGLQAKVAELEAMNKVLRESNLKVIGDIDGIRERADKLASKTGQITYKEIRSYVPMKLYHVNGINIGKVVGPIHPSNAVETALRFKKDVGIILSANPPTAAQIEEYKQTEEYIKAKIKFDSYRNTLSKSRKESEIEKLTKEISKMAGIPRSEVVSIKRQEDVR